MQSEVWKEQEAKLSCSFGRTIVHASATVFDLNFTWKKWGERLQVEVVCAIENFAVAFFGHKN